METLPFKTWAYEEQTQVKHKVFADYFDKWVKIVGKYHNINYIDGFGGCGAYSDKHGDIYYGSPILAAKIVLANKKKDAAIGIIEKELDNIENLKKVFDYLKIPLKPIYTNASFDDAVNKILDKVSLAPTFFFVDPFGFTIKYDTIKRLMGVDHSEVLLNFMFNGVNRFISKPELKHSMDALFGTDAWLPLSKLHGVEKENSIVNLYRQQLKKIAKFVFPYRVEFPDAHRTYYYLFHLSNHPKASIIMKSSFAKFNFGRVEYIGSDSAQLTLSEIAEIRIPKIEEFLRTRYSKKSIGYTEIIEDIIDETPYLESEIAQALKNLEQSAQIYLERFPKTTEKRAQLRRSIQAGDIIYFDVPPSITRKSLLYKTGVEYGDYTINHVFGCAHGCRYPCYAMMMAKTYGRIVDETDWLYPKVVSNALELLDKEIPKYKEDMHFVHLSFTTDPFMYDLLNQRTYPQIERLTLAIIKRLNSEGICCTTLTKGLYPLELTDISSYNKDNNYGITLVSLDEKFKKEFEPYSAPFDERIKNLKYLHDYGLKTWVSIEPYPTPNTLPDSKAGCDLDKLLDKISFVNLIIFGKMNYNTTSTKFPDNAEFYKDCVSKVVSFCTKNKIKYYIKEGTPGHIPLKKNIFD